MYQIGDPTKAPASPKTLFDDAPQSPAPTPVEKKPRARKVDVAPTTGTLSVDDVKVPVPVSTKPQPSAPGMDLGAFGAVFASSLDQVIKQKAEDMRPEILAVLQVELQKLKPTIVTIQGRPQGAKLTGRVHKLFPSTLFMCEQERQVLMVGPAGSGKTTLASQIAEAFKIDFASISCSAGMSEAHLLGRMLFDGTYVPSDFITCYENGGVFLFDEIDAADSNTLLVINSALANGYVSVPNRKDNPRAKRHNDFICVAAGNSWGNGSTQYQGRGYLDAAFLDRFSCSKIEIDYDTDLESELSGGDNVSLQKMWEIRRIVKDQRMKRIVSTRSLVSVFRQVKAGKKLKEVLETFTADWSKDELAKIKL